MTHIEKSSLRLLRFLRKNCAPEDAGDQEDDWPVAIMCDDEATSDKLAALFQDVEDQFEAAGIPVRN